MVSASVRRQQVAFVQRRGLSLRRACALLRVPRSTIGYESRLAKKDAPVLEAMHELAGQYPRYGYRRIQVFLSVVASRLVSTAPTACGALQSFRCRVKGLGAG